MDERDRIQTSDNSYRLNECVSPWSNTGIGCCNQNGLFNTKILAVPTRGIVFVICLLCCGEMAAIVPLTGATGNEGIDKGVVCKEKFGILTEKSWLF